MGTLKGVVLIFVTVFRCSHASHGISSATFCGDKVDGFCQLTSTLDNPDVSCQSTSTAKCDGTTYMGAGSTCQRIDDLSTKTYRCSGGQWKIAVVQTKPKVRKRRGWLFWGRRQSSSPPAPPPNRPPQFTTCPSNIIETAPSGATSASVNYSIPTASDPEDGTPRVERIEGKSSGSIFDEGISHITYKATDRGNLTALCTFSITVQVTYCSDESVRSIVENGQRSCSGEKNNIYGSVCNHSCNTGYRLNDTSPVQCLSSGAWDRPFPICAPVSCGNPGSVVGGSFTCPHGHVYPQNCSLQCQTGFENAGVRTISCTSSEQWTSAGECVDVQPPTFPNGCPADQHLFSGPLEAPVTLNWSDPMSSDNSGDGVTLTSFPAKLSRAGPGTHTVTIIATDETGNNASCAFLVVVEARKCEAFHVTEGGRVNCTRNFVEGSVCTVTCNRGYRVQGQNFVTCLRSETWSSPLPVCEVVVCQPPPPQVDGEFVCANGHQFSSKCALHCNPGHSVSGQVEIECLQNATWSSFGTCIDVDPPEFVQKCPADITVYASRLGEETHVSWTPPQVRDSSGQAVLLTSIHTPGETFMPGQTLVTYTAVDPSGNKATCNFSVTVSVLTCQDPTSVSSMSSLSFQCPDGHVFGSACTIRCSEHHQLVGSDRVTCEQDNTTHPPTMTWEWEGGLPLKPECRESQCPVLQTPKNGALSCFLGYLGWDCLMSCRQNYDVPAWGDGFLYCTNVYKQWVPSTAPDCVESRRPHGGRLHGELFYLAENCDVSPRELRRSFVTRISNSTFKDACVNMPSCVAENIEVTCGPVSERKKRETNSEAERDLLTRIGRVRRATDNKGTHYVLITFQINMACDDSTMTDEDVYLALLTNKEEIVKATRADARAGLLNVDFLEASEHSVKFGPVHINCPAGTLPGKGRNKNFFSCAGCGAGHYLTEGSWQCEACPVGSYTELDNATSCTPCPPGWSTLTTGSKTSSDCEAVNHV